MNWLTTILIGPPGSGVVLVGRPADDARRPDSSARRERRVAGTVVTGPPRRYRGVDVTTPDKDGGRRSGAGRRAPRLPYMPGIDGLRAVAVAAVVAYHAGATWLPGGFLGVDVFLVISGFLITSLLLAELRASGRIDLPRFWLRRARRLLPAVFLMIAVVLAVMLLLHPDEVGRLRGATAASLLYVMNWYQVLTEQSYFEQFARPSVLQHLWSLALEEQFYLLWPPVMAVGITLFGRRRLLWGVLAGAAGSAALAAVLWAPGVDPSRIYYGTDTRAAPLLAGVALAFLWPAARLARARTERRWALDAIGVAAALALAGLMLSVGELDRALYQGGFLVTGIVTALLLAVVAHPASRVGAALALAPLVWLGVRSYGIYLWHWPVIMLTRPERDVPFDGPALVALRLGLTVGIAALSYRYVEQPFRRHGFAGVRAWLDAQDGARRRRRGLAGGTAAAVAAVAIAVAVIPAQAPTIPGIPPSVSAVAAVQPAGAGATDPAPGARPANSTEAGASTARPATRRILAVGDSVMLGASPALRGSFGSRLSLDAAVARQFPETAAAAVAAARALRPSVVVLHIGTNGYIPFEGLEGLLEDLRAVPVVVLVTVRVDERWEGSNNDALAYAARRRANVVVADWHAATEGRSDLLVDGAHPDAEGARLYTEVLSEAIREAPG